MSEKPLLYEKQGKIFPRALWREDPGHEAAYERDGEIIRQTYTERPSGFAEMQSRFSYPNPAAFIIPLIGVVLFRMLQYCSVKCYNKASGWR
jgi:hypothetical protein